VALQARGVKTLQEDGKGILVLDQTQLPHKVAFARLADLHAVVSAIRDMQVRGAPLIGATAAYGVAIGLTADNSDASLELILNTLAATRPTAVNLHWALERMRQTLWSLEPDCRVVAAWREARRIATDDATANALIGQHGLDLMRAHANGSKEIQVMTHCNAGRLATVEHGTALAVVYAAQHAGLPVHVWVSETRPRNQGLLTAWELAEAGVRHTLIADNAAGLMLMQARVDLVIVGADRVAANGDTANKIGTYLKALAAKAHGIPFYVAAPMSSFDLSCPTGAGIKIEERTSAELTESLTRVFNPAFDVTPADLVSGFITERGIFAPDQIRQQAALWKN
jgi:methylthioribose-1-phosphate isomerase